MRSEVCRDSRGEEDMADRDQDHPLLFEGQINSILDTSISQSQSSSVADAQQEEISDDLIWNPTKLLQCCSSIEGQEVEFTHEPVLRSEHSADFEDAAERLLRSNVVKGSSTGIQHIRQSDTWDCGIACLQMILRWLRKPDTDDGAYLPSSSYISPVEVLERKFLLKNAGTKSVWTVDLIMLLENLLNDQKDKDQQPSHKNTTYLFCSEVMGVNSSYSTTGYYQKAFSDDSNRVMKLNEDIVNLKLPTLCPFHLEFEKLLNFITYDHCIAIVLVDNLILMKQDDDDHDETEDVVLKEKNDNYMGHYVVVCGISRDPDHLVSAYSHREIETLSSGTNDLVCLVVVNPGIMKRVMYVRPQRLELAWRADGTDCDVIFIAKHRGA